MPISCCCSSGGLVFISLRLSRFSPSCERLQKRICFVIKKGNSETFYEQLKQLNNQIGQEWESQGNNLQEFREQGPKIVIILDNASFHKKTRISR